MNEFHEHLTGLIFDEKSIREKYPNITFPSVLDNNILNRLGFSPILEVPEPVIAFHQVAVRDGVTKDSFGNTIYNWVVTDLPSEILLEKLKEKRLSKWREIQAIRDSKMAGGVLVDGKWFHTDTGSLVQYLAMLAAGSELNNMLNVIQWKTMDGTFVSMTSELVKAIYARTMITTNIIHDKAEALRLELDIASDPSRFEIENNVGWPIVYQDTL